MKVGIVGESPNDTEGLAGLFKEQFSEHQFRSVFKNRKDHQTAVLKLQKLIKIENKKRQYDLLIVSRDLDDPESDQTALSKRQEWFLELQKGIDPVALFLLHIYEIEALILSDVESLLKHFGGKLKFTGDPMKQEDPKEFLKKKWMGVKKYHENDCPKILPELNYETIKSNCRYFQAFDKNLKQNLSA